MLNNLDEAITYCLEVAEVQEDFYKFKCDYRMPGCEDGVWKFTCRLPSNIPKGCSWGECSESNCPLFSSCLEYAKDHRQLAELLKELKKWREFGRKNAQFINDWIIQNRIDKLFSSEIKSDADVLRIANEALTLRTTNEFCKSCGAWMNGGDEE